MLARNENGTFKRTRKRFSLDNFDDGYVDNRGRFRVWLPDHSRAYADGYVLRSIVVYEVYHGISVPPKMDIHHIDGNRLNDSKENLEMIPHGKHTGISNMNRGMGYSIRICKNCGNEFLIKKWRLKDPNRGQFCTQDCYHSYPKSKKHKNAISKGLKKAYREKRR